MPIAPNRTVAMSFPTPSSPQRRATRPVATIFRTAMLAAMLTMSFSSIGRAVSSVDRAVPGRPNIILIMTDNHGAWTLGCYGNPEIRTPHIDRLARQGIRFTRAFACNPVCSPTRASYLTGLMPSQHGVHCFLFAGRLQIGPQARCTLDHLRSLPEILGEHGYACGLVGKWHLGGNLEPQEGFDDYWVTMPHGGTSSFYNAQVIEHGRVRREPTYLTDFWTRHAIRFIRHQAGRDQPFFLFLSYNGPYALGPLLLREGRNRHAAYYRHCDLAAFPREPAHPWLYNNRDYINQPVAIRRVATEVSGIDDGVGRVLATLEELGLERNTLILFVADQGWVGGHGGFFGMGDHTRPVTARDGMMQVPMIWWQPGKIAAGRTVDQLVSIVDVMPSLLSHVGLADEMPRRPVSPGRDFSPALRGEPLPHWKNEVFYEFESLRCIRTDRWKYVHRFPEGPHELYDLKSDPAEENNLVDDRAFAHQRIALQRRLDAFFQRYAEPKYDLWHGGTSQTRLLVWNDDAANRKPQTNTDDGDQAGGHGKAARKVTASSPKQPAGRPAESPLKPFEAAPIEVPDGFEVTLAAAPPLVRHPTMATFDDRGRLFVCESAGRNLSAAELEKERPNSIRLLEDTDGDGRFDRATTFADRMTFPMGAAWYDGALYVASPPHIWKLEDTDGDGVADRRTILVRKFGYTGNAASIHGCFPGPDGRLYWCDGYHGHEFHDAQGKLVSKREGSYIFSCRPDGSDVRIHAGGGMDNPVEVDFLPSGEMLGTVNILYTRPRVDCLVHWLYGGTYPHRARILAERKTTGELLGPVHRFGHVAVSGLVRYRSGLLDRKWRDHFFVTFFNSGRVVRVALTRHGSTFGATEREFLSSPSHDFHPTDVAEDGDGSLLVVDTGGWFYRGCPTSQLAKPDVLGAIYRVRRRSMPKQLDPWGRKIDWTALTPADCIRYLGDPRHAVRQRAIAECAARGPAMIAPLRQAMRHRDRRWRLGAVWSLAQMATRAAAGGADRGPSSASQMIPRIVSILQEATADRDLEVQLAACHALSVHPHASSRATLEQRLASDQPAVRRVAAQALGRIGDAASVGPLLEGLDRAADRSEEHALIYALMEIDAPVETAAGLASKSARVRRGALIALDQMDAPQAAERITPDIVLAAIGDADEPLRRAALDILRRRPKWIAQTHDLLEQWLADAASLAAHRTAAKQLLHIALSAAPVGQLVGQLLADEQLDADRRSFLLRAIARRRPIEAHPSWLTPLRHELRVAQWQRRAQAVAAAGALRPNPFHDELLAMVSDASAPKSLRLAAAEAMTTGSGSLPPAIFEFLRRMLGTGATTTERAQAAQLIARAALDRQQLLELTSHLPTAGPILLPELIRPFQRSADPQVARALLDRLAEARSLESIAPHQLSEIVKRYPQTLLPRANALLGRLRRTDQNRRRKITVLLDRLPSADPSRGEKLFFSERAKCSTCHRVGARGKRIGPELTTIGANRSPQDLVESILFPAATIVRQYEPFMVALADGRVLNGLISQETATHITLQPATGDPVVIAREDIEELQPAAVSIMPAGLDRELAPQELADIVAFLMSRRSADDAAQNAEE